MLTEPKESHVLVPSPDGTDEHRVHYYEWGSSDAARTVLCVHGLTRTGRDFDVLAKALAGQGFRVLCPDMPGRGKSQWMYPLYYNVGNYVLDIFHLLKQAKVDRVDWVGTSMGGIIAMLFANVHPGSIHSLVLNDIGSYVPASGLNRITSSINNRPKFTSRSEAESWLRTVSLAPFGITKEEHWQHMFAHSIREEHGEWKMHYDPAIVKSLEAPQEGPPQDMDLTSFCQALVNVPTLLVYGAKSDLVTPEVIARTRAMWGKDTVFKEYSVEAAGHAPSLMNDDEVAVACGFILAR